jgi:hypothetical protein
MHDSAPPLPRLQWLATHAPGTAPPLELAACLPARLPAGIPATTQTTTSGQGMAPVSSTSISGPPSVAEGEGGPQLGTSGTITAGGAAAGASSAGACVRSTGLLYAWGQRCAAPMPALAACKAEDLCRQLVGKAAGCLGFIGFIDSQTEARSP